jgi:hypothetical protein
VICALRPSRIHVCRVPGSGSFNRGT